MINLMANRGLKLLKVVPKVRDPTAMSHQQDSKIDKDNLIKKWVNKIIFSRDWQKISLSIIWIQIFKLPVLSIKNHLKRHFRLMKIKLWIGVISHHKFAGAIESRGTLLETFPTSLTLKTKVQRKSSLTVHCTILAPLIQMKTLMDLKDGRLIKLKLWKNSDMLKIVIILTKATNKAVIKKV